MQALKDRSITNMGLKDLGSVKSSAANQNNF